MNKIAKEYIEKLQLQLHPEGGYYKEIYRAGEIILPGHLPVRYKSSRSFATSIYFLLEGNQVSKFHKLKSDEQWHFYDGTSLSIFVIDASGELITILLGRDIKKGESFQTVIKRESWFGAELVDKNSFALVGCTVSPGFDFNDFEIGERNDLINKFPIHKKIIMKLTNE